MPHCPLRSVYREKYLDRNSLWSGEWICISPGPTAPLQSGSQPQLYYRPVVWSKSCRSCSHRCPPSALPPPPPLRPCLHHCSCPLSRQPEETPLHLLGEARRAGTALTACSGLKRWSEQTGEGGDQHWSQVQSNQNCGIFRFRQVVSLFTSPLSKYRLKVLF